MHHFDDSNPISNYLKWSVNLNQVHVKTSTGKKGSLVKNLGSDLCKWKKQKDSRVNIKCDSDKF